jgi:putative SOS response-associated peptidase YedK
LAQIHHRCPVILGRQQWSLWLDRDLDEIGELKSFLRPSPDDLLEIQRVGYEVGNVRNDDPSLTAPV